LNVNARRSGRWRALILVVCAGGAVWVAACSGERGGAAGAARAAAAPSGDGAAHTAFLAAELAAARDRRLYLVVEPEETAIDLKVDGFQLHRFPAHQALFGVRRLGGGPVRWPATSFRLITDILERDRLPIPIGRPPDDPASASLEHVPTHYRLRFEPALDVVVEGETAGLDPRALLWRLGQRLRDGWEALADAATGAPTLPRLLLRMAPDEAQRLFVALRRDIRLLVDP
jgi:hypothetical protein